MTHPNDDIDDTVLEPNEDLLKAAQARIVELEDGILAFANMIEDGANAFVAEYDTLTESEEDDIANLRWMAGELKSLL